MHQPHSQNGQGFNLGYLTHKVESHDRRIAEIETIIQRAWIVLGLWFAGITVNLGPDKAIEALALVKALLGGG